MPKFKRNAGVPQIDFVGKRKIFFSIPIVLIIITIFGAIFLGFDLDVKFKGGTIINCPYSGEVDLQKVQTTAQDALQGSVTVQTTESGGSHELVITLSENKEISIDQLSSLTEALKKDFPDNVVVQDQNEITVTTVSSQIGTEFFQKCLVAVAFAFLALIIYIGIRFRKIGGISAAIMAIIGLFHDIIIAFMIVVFFRFPINDAFMAVMLTILGYSINNTIVIYDRIRENKGKLTKGTPIREIVNLSINQTLSRSINTTVTTLLALLVTLIMSLVFHISSIVSFVLPMMFGILAGAYSSICVSGPLWVWWKEKHPDKEKKHKKKEKKPKFVTEPEEPVEIEVRTSFKVNKKALEKFKDSDK